MERKSGQKKKQKTVGQKQKPARLYREVTVWRPLDDRTLIRYRCLHILPDDKYYVKSSDFVHDPLEDKVSKDQERYYLESLFSGGLETSVEDVFDSLEEAILKHEQDFEMSF